MPTMEKNNKTLNVPHLRFPEFSGEWETSILLDVCEINPKTPSLDEEFVYIDLESVEKGTILHENVISRDDAPSRAQRVLKFNDILFQCVRPYQKNNLLFSGDTHTLQYVASTGYAQIRTDKQNPAFLYQLLNTQKFVDQVMLRCTGTSYPAINANDLSKIPICYPLQIEEQNKIAKLLSLLDNRIETQKKIIEDLKKLKDAIRTKLFRHIESTCVSYDEIRNMLDYEQPSGYLVSSTEYSDNYQTPVLTANKAFILGYTDEVHGIYDNGECIILDDFTMDVKYVTFPFKIKSSAIKILTAKKDVDLYFMYEYLLHLGLVSEEHKRHYISEIEPMTLSRPTLQEQKRISQTLKALDMQVQSANRLNDLLLKQRKYITSQMFI